MNKLIEIEVKPTRPDMWRSPACAPIQHVRQSLPFVENSRAVLVHRVRHIEQHKLGDRRPHLAIKMWCGNTQCGMEKFTFHDDPPKDKLVCQRCEFEAVAAGKPNSADLANRPINTGKTEAVMVRTVFQSPELLDEKV